jgi:hypothetical protein
VVGHPGVLESVGLAVDEVLVSGPDVVGEVELAGFVAEIVLERRTLVRVALATFSSQSR